MTSSPPLLRVGQIGVGHFGAARRQWLRQSGLYSIEALCDWNPEYLARAASEEEARACNTYEELLDTPGLDAIVISTGAKYHAGQIVASLRRGLPVFVEKPLCASPAELKAIIKAQSETGLPIGLGHIDHSTQAVSRTVKTWLEEERLGKIVAFEKTTAHSGGFHIKPGDWRGDATTNPGGMLFQCGVHALHELMFYFGAVTEVSAQMRYDVHSTGTADAAICTFKFESGVVGNLNAYHVTPYRHTLSIFGTTANLYRDERYFEEGTRLFSQPLHLDHTFEPREAVPVGDENDPCGNVRAFYQAVKTGQMQYPSLWDGARAVAAIFAAEEAAKSGNRVVLAVN